MTTHLGGLRQRLGAALTSWFEATFPDPTQAIIDKMHADVLHSNTPEAKAERAARRAACAIAADRCYEAAMAQAARHADPAQRERLVGRVRASLAEGDRVMMAVGLSPEAHSRRAAVLKRFAERGI